MELLQRILSAMTKKLGEIVLTELSKSPILCNTYPHHQIIFLMLLRNKGQEGVIALISKCNLDWISGCWQITKNC